MDNTNSEPKYKRTPDVGNKDNVLLPPPEAKLLGALVEHEFGDPAELLEHRFLCRGGGALLTGPTGIGKSSFVLQCAVFWAIGKPAFGIRPSMALRILIVQAENDEGDLAEMRRGVFSALQLSQEERAQACENVLIATESARTGFSFFQQAVEPLLEKHRPDLLIIDPALAYLGGDTNSQKDVGCFLRNQLNPLLTEFQCGCIIVHHTNKPPSGKEKPNWQGGDFAYSGSGSAEWANWARAVLSLRSLGSTDVYELRAGKRGGRLGWRDDAGNKVYHKHIAHAKEPGRICWHEADASELPTGVETAESLESDLLSLVPASGTVPKESLLGRAGVFCGKNKAREVLKRLVAKAVVFEHQKPRSGNKPEIHLSRSRETPKFDDPVVTVVTPATNEGIKTVTTPGPVVLTPPPPLGGVITTAS